MGANDNDVWFTRSNLTYFTDNNVHDYGPSFGLGRKGAGTFISKALDSCPTLAADTPCDTVWYKLDYGGVTPMRSWIGLQTRVADTIDGLLNAKWWPQDLLWDPDGGYWVPLRGYLGPGSYIEQNGSQWPHGRYAQYRVNFWTMNSLLAGSVPPLSYPPQDGFSSTPALYYVTLFYSDPSGTSPTPKPDLPNRVYLPVILKGQASP